MKQQNKQSFIDTLAWIFIVLAGFATLISLLQNIMISVMFPAEEMNRVLEDPQMQEQMPGFIRFMFSNIRVFFFGILLVSGTVFVSAIGLLKRKNWARKLFIVMMCLGICWNIFGLIMQNFMFTSMPEFPSNAMGAPFPAMMMVMKIVFFIFVMGFSYLFGWIIHKLTSPGIKIEFGGAMPVQPEMEPGKNGRPLKRKRKRIIAVAVAVTIAIGAFYFGTGNVRTGTGVSDIQALAASGDANRLAERLSAQPDLANAAQPNRWTPLQSAACNGNLECVGLLISFGADVDAQSCNRQTALHCGAADGNAEIVSLLLGADANPNLEDSKGKTPLDWAIWNNHEDIIVLLEEYGARTSAALSGNQPEMHYPSKRGVEP